MASTANVGVADQATMTDDTTEAYVAANSALSISGGPLSLQATSSDTAESGQVAISAAGVNIKVAKSEANAGGSTSAYVQEGASITATGLNLSANSTNTAEANPIDFGIAAVKVAVAHPIAETTHTTEVYIGPAGTAAPTSGSSGKISVGSGSVTGTATSTNNATVDPLEIGLSGIDVSVLHPEVTAGGSTLSHLGGTFAITAGTVSFTANSTSTADSKSISVELSGVSITDAIKSAQADDATSAFVGKQANLNISGASLALTPSRTTPPRRAMWPSPSPPYPSRWSSPRRMPTVPRTRTSMRARISRHAGSARPRPPPTRPRPAWTWPWWEPSPWP